MMDSLVCDHDRLTAFNVNISIKFLANETAADLSTFADVCATVCRRESGPHGGHVATAARKVAGHCRLVSAPISRNGREDAATARPRLSHFVPAPETLSPRFTSTAEQQRRQQIVPVISGAALDDRCR